LLISCFATVTFGLPAALLSASIPATICLMAA
jgi:hypothetical protein